MKTVKTITLLSGLFLCQLLSAQRSSETITEELSFSTNSSENMLVVQNVNGPISVEGYEGNTIKIEVDKTITAKSENKLEEGKREIGIKVEEVGKRIYVYLDSPWTHFNSATGKFEHRENHDGWEKPKYRYLLDFKLKVPRSTNVKLATMNDGDIYARNIQGNEIIVSNLNGAITLDNVSGRTDVNALNRDINITYFRNPTEDSRYHSLNGDINVTFKEDLNADVSFKSLNGDLYTNYDTAKMTPKLEKKKNRNGKGVKYNLSSNESFRIGKGGIKLDFNLLNGDATVKK
ncbi:MAG: DUF4097 family beta strand repeat-containing protein [Aurantibacter sp.]